MSHDEQRNPDLWERVAYSYLFYLIVVPLLSVGAILLLMSFAGTSTTTKTSGDANRVEEENLAAARQSLNRQTDLTTCRGALNQINSELSEKPQRRPPTLTSEQTNRLREQVGLDPQELAEIDNSNYTQLDGPYLERCFLLRDVARGLEVKGVRKANGEAVRDEGPDLAARAFAWVVREVRLRDHEGEAVPPAFVLRRGWGTPLERALVFLALLEQLGDLSAPRPELLGCLLYLPNDAGAERFWACGVVAGDGKNLYLFDPRLGLPLPGPKGQGIATLGEVREQPELLAALNLDKQRYDVTAEQARTAKARLFCSLSALSPRMRYLQDELLAPAVRVRLAADPQAEHERIQAAYAAGADKPARVEVLKASAGLLRRFLPPEEGGVDRGATVAGNAQRATRKDLFALELVPWTAMPAQFLDPKRFPVNIELGQRIRTLFARPFIVSAQESGHARDQLLRGRYSSAITKLVSEQEHWREQQKQRANSRDLDNRTSKWIDGAIRAYAAQLRGQPGADEAVKALWSDRDVSPVLVLLNSAIAAARNPEIMYLLGLCMQEQAEQLQARLDLQARTPGRPPHPSDLEKAREAWIDARNTWKRYSEDYSNGNERVAVRRLRGRAEAMLGEWQAAAATWKEQSDDMTPLEKLASLYLAQQIEKQHTK